MNRIILTLVACIALSACGQTKTEKNDIDNAKTAEHVNIPGTRLYIVPPTGFKTATSFIGLEKGADAAIEIYDLVDGNYDINAATFVKDEFVKKGATVFDYKEFKMNGFPAEYILMQGYDPNIKAINMVFGDTTFSVLAMAYYPSVDNKTGEQIRNALKTIYYDKNLKIDPFATALFTLDDRKSIFKFSKAAALTFIYSIGGIDVENDQTFVTVTTIPKTPIMNAERVSEMCLSSIEQYGLTDKQLKNSSTANVNGQPAYEVEIYGKMEGKRSLIYLLVIMGGDKAVVIHGIIKSDFDTNLKEIKNLAKTIKLK